MNLLHCLLYYEKTNGISEQVLKLSSSQFLTLCATMRKIQFFVLFSIMYKKEGVLMETYQGVAMTDGVNRKNHVFPLKTIIESYRNAWNSIFPVNVGHDRTKPVGFTRLTGIYMEPGKAYLTNEGAIMDTKEEHEKLHKMIKAHDYKVFCEERKEELNVLTKKLGDKLSDKFRVAPVAQAVAIKDRNIVYRLFPEWLETTKDGLVDIRELEPVYTKSENEEQGFLVPGVYQKDGYLLFAHQFFRRSLSILNTTNEEFFNSFEKMRNNASVQLQLALDMDMIGLLGTEHPEMEYQYIWGPHFDDDLTHIPEGVTCHENEHYDNLFSNLLSTQFYWHIQDGKRTFECEELCDRENVSFDDGQTMLWGCRYVHSMINPTTGLPTHLDGAIRIYNYEQILERIDPKTDISKCGKDSEYVKLWRIDNDFSISMWKELISSFYRENALIGEYFGGVDEKYDQIKKESSEHNSVVKRPNSFAHIQFSPGDGARVYFRYTNKINLAADRDIEISNKDSFIFQGGEKEKIIDADTITLLKYLKRKGLSLRIPITSQIAFGDMIYNFPTLCCKSFHVVDTVISAIRELCEVWTRNGDDRLISFGLMVNLADEAMHISFASHVHDLVQLLGAIPQLSNVTFKEWIEAIYIQNNRYKVGGDYPNKFQLIHGDVLCFKRLIVHPDKIKKNWMEAEIVYTQLSISKEEGEELLQQEITCAPFYKIIEDRCSKCGKNYIHCDCVKFIDENVSDEVVSGKFLGMIWTNRSAFFPDGQLEYVF